MKLALPRRGQPLVALCALFVGWITLRIVLWERIELHGVIPPALEAHHAAMPWQIKSNKVLDLEGSATAHSVDLERTLTGPPVQTIPVNVSVLLMPTVRPAHLPPSGEARETARVAAAHQLAWMAGIAQLPLPQFVTERMNARDQDAGLIPAEARAARVGPLSARRWSVDGWLLLREGGVGTTAAGLPSPSYGASQTGAVIRYRLAPASTHRPALYLRATSAVQTPRGEEVALGLSARPLARVPVALQAELRATQQASGTTWRPAVGAVTELPRFALPAGLTGEVYAQAGYVGGPEATAFVDGQLRIERRLARLGRGELRAGLGAWGGAQKGANRIDVGPSATLDFPVGGGQARVSADWRLRAAGNAAPKSGPAITLSAGF